MKTITKQTASQSFVMDGIFNSSHKMGDAKISREKALVDFGEGEEGCDKSEFTWEGVFKAADGSDHRVSFWDWKGGLACGYGVSVWIADGAYLVEFIKFIEV